MADSDNMETPVVVHNNVSDALRHVKKINKGRPRTLRIPLVKLPHFPSRTAYMRLGIEQLSISKILKVINMCKTEENMKIIAKKFEISVDTARFINKIKNGSIFKRASILYSDDQTQVIINEKEGFLKENESINKSMDKKQHLQLKNIDLTMKYGMFDEHMASSEVTINYGAIYPKISDSKPRPTSNIKPFFNYPDMTLEELQYYIHKYKFETQQILYIDTIPLLWRNLPECMVSGVDQLNDLKNLSHDVMVLLDSEGHFPIRPKVLIPDRNDIPKEKLTMACLLHTIKHDLLPLFENYPKSIYSSYKAILLLPAKFHKVCIAIKRLNPDIMVQTVPNVLCAIGPLNENLKDIVKINYLYHYMQYISKYNNGSKDYKCIVQDILAKYAIQTFVTNALKSINEINSVHFSNGWKRWWGTGSKIYPKIDLTKRIVDIALIYKSYLKPPHTNITKNEIYIHIFRAVALFDISYFHQYLEVKKLKNIDEGDMLIHANKSKSTTYSNSTINPSYNALNKSNLIVQSSGSPDIFFGDITIKQEPGNEIESEDIENMISESQSGDNVTNGLPKILNVQTIKTERGIDFTSNENEDYESSVDSPSTNSNEENLDDLLVIALKDAVKMIKRSSSHIFESDFDDERRFQFMESINSALRPYESLLKNSQ